MQDVVVDVVVVVVVVVVVSGSGSFKSGSMRRVGSIVVDSGSRDKDDTGIVATGVVVVTGVDIGRVV